MNTKPFHESVVHAIQLAKNGAELRAILLVISMTIVPKNHGEIIKALDEKISTLKDDPDYNNVFLNADEVIENLRKQQENEELKKSETKKYLNEELFEYTAKNGTKFISARSDFNLENLTVTMPGSSTEVELLDNVTVHTPQITVDYPPTFLADLSEMIQYHMSNILPLLKDFKGYDKIHYHVHTFSEHKKPA